MFLAAFGMVTADITEVAMPPACELLDGFDLLDGKKPSPVVLPQDCDDTLDHGDPCIYDDKTVNFNTQYLEKLDSS